MDDDYMSFLDQELNKAATIKPKPKINPGPTKSKLVQKNLGFNEGFNSAQYYAQQQTGKPLQEYAQMKQNNQM